MELLEACAEPCPVVHLEWDRGHEQIDAIVRAESADALIVTVVEDFWPQAGCRWIRADEVLSAEVLAPTSPDVRVLDHLGVRPFSVESALLDLEHLLARPTFRSSPVQLCLERTGSGEVQVGTVASLTASEVVLNDITPSGEWPGDQSSFELSGIISVEWGSDYLRALGILVGL